MNTRKTYDTYLKQHNLIGDVQHKQFIELQAGYGIAQRGGTQLPAISGTYYKRLVSNINLLDPSETRSLVFGETLISN